MSLSSISFKSECAFKFHYYIPKPSYHPKNKDVVVISTDCAEDCSGIYEYNLTKNTFNCNKIHTYKQTFYRSHGQFIDPKNELLYIFGNGEFGIFDLNTNVMTIDTESSLRDCNDYPKSTYIPSPINELHILSNGTIHYIMDMNDKNINKMKINKFENNNIKHPKI
eukprot:516396_1